MQIVLLLLAGLMTMEAAPRIEVHGHRGARTVRPENTLAGFEYAMKAGADMLELDLNVTKDDVLVVSHDAAINTKICRGPGGETEIRKLTLDEVRRWDCGVGNPDFPKQQAVAGQRIPAFDEVLALAKRGPARLNIEIKSNPQKPEQAPEPRRYAEMVAAAVRKHGLQKRVMVQSFDFRVLLAMKEAAPELPLSALFGFADRKDLVDASREAGGTQGVSPYYSLATPEQVKKAHAAGLKVFAWTANTAEVWDRLIAAGVDGIITDDPAALIAHLKAKGLR